METESWPPPPLPEHTVLKAEEAVGSLVSNILFAEAELDEMAFRQETVWSSHFGYNRNDDDWEDITTYRPSGALDEIEEETRRLSAELSATPYREPSLYSSSFDSGDDNDDEEPLPDYTLYDEDMLTETDSGGESSLHAHGDDDEEEPLPDYPQYGDDMLTETESSEESSLDAHDDEEVEESLPDYAPYADNMLIEHDEETTLGPPSPHQPSPMPARPRSPPPASFRSFTYNDTLQKDYAERRQKLQESWNTWAEQKRIEHRRNYMAWRDSRAKTSSSTKRQDQLQPAAVASSSCVKNKAKKTLSSLPQKLGSSLAKAVMLNKMASWATKTRQWKKERRACAEELNRERYSNYMRSAERLEDEFAKKMMAGSDTAAAVSGSSSSSSSGGGGGQLLPRRRSGSIRLGLGSGKLERGGSRFVLGLGLGLPEDNLVAARNR
ncbi:hypothetical protein B0H63DRAFT_527204 [Podospora didyma]|uniref:Uncharacterized protein n=1 Tax=Podospora didyma TaxID=330526 RepID=A0AAE0N6C1_9PEZI|nr:hypothetical protein B0H63DRAFT_527204 [Podospora didyma]